jgi:hypothetical protein
MGAMKPSSIERALEAMESMQKGKPYSLRPDDPKRKLADELARLARELKIKPVIIGGLAVNHHGYLRVTADVVLLLSKDDAVVLFRRLKTELGWKRYHEGFKNTFLDVAVDLCVEGERTSPAWAEVFPNPADLQKQPTRPLPVLKLPDLIALKAMSGRAKDEGDAVELLKRHPARIASVHRAARALLHTDEAGRFLDSVVARAKDEIARRR